MTDTPKPGPPRPLQGATSGHLLALIRSRPAWTRQQLIEATGMSRPTLLDRLGPLFRHGLVYAAGVGASLGGRPAELIRFDDRHMVVLTIDVGHTHGRVAVTGVPGADVPGAELRCAGVRLDVPSTPPDRTVRALVTLARTLLSRGRGERLIGVGVGLPGPVSPATGLTGPTTTMPGWESYPLLERLREQWPVPLVLENDARALVLGEATRHAGATLLGVKWASGIGAGLVVDGRSLGGDDGAAGDIGHVTVSRGGPECRCGRLGCLAAYASGHALLARLRPAGVTCLDDLAERALRRDPAVRAALRAAARRVGSVLAALIALTNPRTLVLGGTIGALPSVVETVASRVRHVTLGRSTEGLRIVPSELGERAATVGLVHLVLERVLSPEAVDRALA